MTMIIISTWTIRMFNMKMPLPGAKRKDIESMLIGYVDVRIREWRLLCQIHLRRFKVLEWLNPNRWERFRLCKSKIVRGDFLLIEVLDLLDL